MHGQDCVGFIMVQYQKTNAAIKWHKWEVTCQVVVNDAISKHAKAEHVRNRLITIIANYAWTRNGQWHKVIGQGQPHLCRHNRRWRWNQRIGFGVSAFDPMSWSLHVTFCCCGARVEILQYKFLAEVGAPFREALPHRLEQCQNLGVAKQLVRNFYAICLSFDRLGECSKIHAGMELWGIIMHGTISLRGRLWESGLHVLSINGEGPKVGC